MNQFFRVNRTFFLRMAARMALLLAGTLFPRCSLITSFDPKDATIDALSFNTTAVRLPYGSMDMLSLTIEPARAQAEAGVVWEFDHTVIAGKADNFSLIMTGIRAGETIVRARAYGKTAACVVTVLPGSGEPAVTNPYVYSAAEYVEVAPGDTVKI